VGQTTITDVAAALDVVDLPVFVASRGPGPSSPTGGPAADPDAEPACILSVANVSTMGELSDRRARKKAQTRDQVRRTAQRLFAERGFEAVTIADVAAAADVAVQTVFNHFATKEEIFFSDRTPWRDGPAQSVRTRAEDTGPLAALRAHLLTLVEAYMCRASTPEHRRLMATLEASPALRAHERLLHQEAEARLREALEEAWREPTGTLDEFVPDDPRLAGGLVAALWLGAIRVLLVDQRHCPPKRGDRGAVERVRRTAEDLLDRVERTLEPTWAREHAVRRAS
jgi:AcrR family transcriptional regulator